MKDADYGIPIFSLYSETRSPTRDAEAHDTLVVDLQDVGTRVLHLRVDDGAGPRSLREGRKSIVVLDRPNLSAAWRSRGT